MKVDSKFLRLISVLFFIPLSLIGCTASGEPSGETKIFEIANTEELVGKKGEVLTLRKHYMILNPPRDLIDLKNLIEGYVNNYPVERENRFIHLSFYRESDDLPRDWQPDERYMNTDRLEHHKSDLIASVTWSDTQPQKEYDVYDKNEEGRILKRMRFIEDRPVG